MIIERDHDLIVTIVSKGRSERVIKASKQAGAEGGTILFARGTGIRETKSMFGIPIEPEKEMVLTIVPTKITSTVLEAIVQAGDLRKPGAGIAFVLPIKAVAGICHLLPGGTTPDDIICK
jgi:nitrogen regulatory protein P-II 1